VAGHTDRGRVPPKPRVGEPRRWRFSFRYWKQLPNFGCDDLKDGWFVSLLDRFREMGKQSVDDALDYIDSSDGPADAMRFHRVTHGHRHVTMNRADFDWLDAAILADETN